MNVPFTSSGETSMYAGKDFLCALRTGEMYCWGNNNTVFGSYLLSYYGDCLGLTL